MNMSQSLDSIAFEFFREFARCEYCLKAVGIRKPKQRNPTADWGAFASQVTQVFDNPANDGLAEAIRYYLQRPPKKQVLRNELLDWDDTLPKYKSQAELVLLLICQARNNLFHGGKFNGHWFEPQRSEELLSHGLTILRAVVSAHGQVREACDGKAV